MKILNKTHKSKKYRLKIDCFFPVFPLTSAILVPLANELGLAQYPDVSSEPIRCPGDDCSRDIAQTRRWAGQTNCNNSHKLNPRMKTYQEN